ncbi:hypothetical protein Q1695_000191 [Nippostrongylus brasiliensis]|nr:hypothetical protein Q1695_000191 [Nippostrongylus brasiliensis]
MAVIRMATMMKRKTRSMPVQGEGPTGPYMRVRWLGWPLGHDATKRCVVVGAGGGGFELVHGAGPLYTGVGTRLLRKDHLHENADDE